MNVIVSAVLVLREGGTLLPAWSRPVMRSTLAFGLRGYVGNVMQFFNYRLDMLLVNGFIGAAGVGIYGTSVRLAELLWNLPNAVGFVIFPKAASTSAKQMNRFTPRVFRITMMLTTIGAVGLALVGQYLIVLVYGPEFASAYVPMLALLPGVVLLGGAKVLTNEIAGRGFPHYNSITAAISLVLTIVLDLLLIPPYGVLGASIASSISYAVIFVAALIFYRIVSRRTARASARQELEAGEGPARG
jgi:O-antigen/teichoic acid export membrane protein